MTKRRYVVCGVSSRAIGMWIHPMYHEFSHAAEFVGMLDIDPLRFQVCKREIPESANVPTYMPEEFDKMIEETKPDAVFVVCRDCYHVTYILKALEKGLDVITEKPMTTNWEDGIKVVGNTLYYYQAVHQESDVIPENIDCIRSMCKMEQDPAASVRKTNDALGIPNKE